MCHHLWNLFFGLLDLLTLIGVLSLLSLLSRLSILSRLNLLGVLLGLHRGLLAGYPASHVKVFELLIVDPNGGQLACCCVKVVSDCSLIFFFHPAGPVHDGPSGGLLLHDLDQRRYAR